MNQMQQLLIVIGVLLLLPVAVKLLWKIRLLPVGLYFVSTRLFWPGWAVENKALCTALLAASVLFFFGAWGLKFLLKRRREQEWIRHVLATTKPMYEMTDIPGYKP